MTPDTQLAIHLREKELEKWQLKEADHWNEYLHAQRNIYRLEGEINRLKIKNESEEEE